MCSAIVACAEIIPAFVPPPPPPAPHTHPIIFPLQQTEMLTLSFFSPHFPHSSQNAPNFRLLFPRRPDLEDAKKKLSPTRGTSKSTGFLNKEINFRNQTAAFLRSAQAHRKHHVFTVDCQHCAEASVCSSMGQERQLSLLWNNTVGSLQQLKSLITGSSELHRK